MAGGRRVHFVNPVRNVIACGLPPMPRPRPVGARGEPPERTSNPAEVTCGPCKRTIAYRTALPSLEL